MAVVQSIGDLVDHAVVHVLQRRRHPADIQLALLTCAAHGYISRRVQKNCSRTDVVVREGKGVPHKKVPL